jgi:hypothetical protein
MAKLQRSTPERRRQLVRLAEKYSNHCLQGHRVCRNLEHYEYRPLVCQEWVTDKAVPREGRNKQGEPTGIFYTEWQAKQVPCYNYYDAFSDEKPYLDKKVMDGVIESWKAEDRERRNYEWKLEQRQLHDGTYGKYGSAFDPVARDVFFSNRPEYYLVAMGVNAFSFDRVALIRIPSTSVHLFVDVGGAVQEVSKNARRKALRHRKFSGALKDKIDENCKAAVAEWWASKR